MERANARHVKNLDDLKNLVALDKNNRNAKLLGTKKGKLYVSKGGLSKLIGRVTGTRAKERENAKLRFQTLIEALPDSNGLKGPALFSMARRIQSAEHPLSAGNNRIKNAKNALRASDVYITSSWLMERELGPRPADATFNAQMGGKAYPFSPPLNTASPRVEIPGVVRRLDYRGATPVRAPSENGRDDAGLGKLKEDMQKIGKSSARGEMKNDKFVRDIVAAFSARANSDPAEGAKLKSRKYFKDQAIGLMKQGLRENQWQYIDMFVHDELLNEAFAAFEQRNMGVAEDGVASPATKRALYLGLSRASSSIIAQEERPNAGRRQTATVQGASKLVDDPSVGSAEAREPMRALLPGASAGKRRGLNEANLRLQTKEVEKWTQCLKDAETARVKAHKALSEATGERRNAEAAWESAPNSRTPQWVARMQAKIEKASDELTTAQHEIDAAFTKLSAAQREVAHYSRQISEADKR